MWLEHRARKSWLKRRLESSAGFADLWSFGSWSPVRWEASKGNDKWSHPLKKFTLDTRHRLKRPCLYAHGISRRIHKESAVVAASGERN